MRRTLTLLLALAVTTPAVAAERDTLYQVSTIDALLVGLYDGVLPIAALREHGDFGIGTLHGVDGELLALDGRFYQVAADGKVHEVADSAETPFATVSFFQGEQRFELADLDMAALGRAVDERLGSDNLPQAIRIEGTFRHVRTRSVPRQQPPYPPLTEVAKAQSVFEFNDVRGVMVGYRLPAFMAKVNVPGYHLHFLTEERTAGGHVLAFTADTVTVATDELSDFHMHLPTGGAFRGADLRPDREKELHKVEK